jgi:hypothetical protein
MTQRQDNIGSMRARSNQAEPGVFAPISILPVRATSFAYWYTTGW